MYCVNARCLEQGKLRVREKRRSLWELPILSAHFFFKPKISLKIKSIKEKEAYNLVVGKIIKQRLKYRRDSVIGQRRGFKSYCKEICSTSNGKVRKGFWKK